MKFSPNATVLERLLDELQSVSEHADIKLCGDDTVIVTAWVTPGHAGADVNLDEGANNPHVQSPRRLNERLPLPAALEDVLQKIALAAPMEVSA